MASQLPLFLQPRLDAGTAASLAVACLLYKATHCRDTVTGLQCSLRTEAQISRCGFSWFSVSRHTLLLFVFEQCLWVSIGQVGQEIRESCGCKTGGEVLIPENTDRVNGQVAKFLAKVVLSDSNLLTNACLQVWPCRAVTSSPGGSMKLHYWDILFWVLKRPCEVAQL